MSDRDASLLVAELRSLLRTRDERLTAIEHDLNNEVGTLQLVVQLIRQSGGGHDADWSFFLDALMQTTGRIRRLVDGLGDGRLTIFG
jgi:hypothetical protein